MAGGNFGGGDGSVIMPFLIEDLADLNAIRNNMASLKYYKLVNDIDASLDELDKIGLSDSGKGWKPLGSGSAGFYAQINFNFKKIKNLYINRPSESYIGLIGYNNNVTVPCVVRPRLEGVNIQGADFTGGVIGYDASNAGIAYNNITVTGSLIQGNSNVGGFAGYLTGSKVIDGKIDVTHIQGINYIGGIVGGDAVSTANGSITRCLVIADLISGVTYVGGIKGKPQYPVSYTHCIDCEVKIKTYERLSGSSLTFGTVTGIAATLGVVKALDTRKFISV